MFIFIFFLEMTSYEPVDCTKTTGTFQDYEKCLFQENKRHEKYLDEQYQIQQKETGYKDFLFIQQTLDKELSALKHDNYKDIKQTAKEKVAGGEGSLTKYYMKSQQNSFVCNAHCRGFLKSFLVNKNKDLKSQTFTQNSKLRYDCFQSMYGWGMQTSGQVGFYLHFE